MESGKITAEEEKFTDPIRRYESDILQLLDHWDSFNTDSKIGVILEYLSFLISLESLYVDYLYGKLDEDRSPPKHPLLFHATILKRIDIKLWNQSRINRGRQTSFWNNLIKMKILPT